MNIRNQDKRIEMLRQDPDFRALVKLLDSQSAEQVDAFYSQYEREEGQEMDHDRAGGQDRDAVQRTEGSGEIRDRSSADSE
jgi:hypothetical protein